MLQRGMRLVGCLFGLLCLFTGGPAVKAQSGEPRAMKSVFYTEAMVRQAAANAKQYAWAADAQKQIVLQAKPWEAMTDDQLWSLMFGSTIKRAWQVWSNGTCPACKQPVPMYNWKMDPFADPWKTRCPHCNEAFPKNDFHAYYRSGLDSHGVFDPGRADRTLLFNKDHPDPKDPLHLFGVDDGEGYVEGGHRWRFIGAYLIYGQWKQAIVAGIVRLSAAYAATRNPVYAHKAGVLLDRVADLYPTHDFGLQGVMYEGAPRSGYVSTWHDACLETRQMALGYDMVRDALANDAPLAEFLAAKAAQFGIPAAKRTTADVLKNIEAGMLLHPLSHLDRIYCNYPQTEMTVAIIKSIMGGADGDQEAMRTLDSVLDKSTAVDGVTGEKGLTGYSVFATHNIATVLALYARSMPEAFHALVQRHPRLREMFRFHLDTLCCDVYYPRIGDCGTFAQPGSGYVGVTFSPVPDVAPSLFTFFWRLYEETKDPAFVQILYRANGDKTAGLPYELSAADPDALQARVRAIIRKEGARPNIGSVNKSEWHLAILRSGEKATARALWLDYDSGGYHAHRDGMNIGLFARGLDLLPDFGYPPVQFGGWDSPRAVWYTMTAAHNTVVVDGRNHRNDAGALTERAGYEGRPAGKTTLWAPGRTVQAVRASCPEMIDGQQFERTVAMADITDQNFYVLDIFRVVGGSDHARFLHGAFGALTTNGLDAKPAPDYGFNTQMRSFRTDPHPESAWSADWKVEDRNHRLPEGADVHLRYTDLTTGAEASTAESWISPAGYGADDQAWIHSVMLRRHGGAPLISTFVGVLEPYDRRPDIVQARRLPLQTAEGAACADTCAAVEVRLRDGRQDLWMAADSKGSPPADVHPLLVQKESQLALDGDLAFVRRSGSGDVERLMLCRGRSLRAGSVMLQMRHAVDWIEVEIKAGQATVLSGPADEIERLTIGGRPAGKVRKR